MAESDTSTREPAALQVVGPQPRLPDDDGASIEALRTILLHDQRRDQSEQDRRLREIEQLLLEDAHLIERLAPVLGASIRRRIADKPDELIEVFYPVVVPMIGHAVTESIRDLARYIDGQMRRMFNFGFLLRVLWARVRGLDPAEVAIRDALPFQPNELLLIHRESGLLLAYVARDGGATPDLDLVSGMLTAIRDFARDAFGAEQPGSLDAIQHGQLSILVEAHGHTYLAAVIEGIEPRGYRQRMRAALIAVERDVGPVLQQYQGDASALGDVGVELMPLLEPNPAARGLTGSQRAILGGCSALLALSLLLVCGGGGFWLRQQLARPSVPAYIVVLPPTATASPSATSSPTATPSPTPTAPPVTPTPTPTSPPVAGVMTGSVWVRSGPATETLRIGVVVPNGQPVEILGASGLWVLIRWEQDGRSYTGWTPARYLQSSRPIPTLTPAAVAP